MRIGTVTEIKKLERRVGLTPAVVATLVAHGHELFVQSGAGAGVGLSDADYAAAGATIVPDAPDVFNAAELIVKVKEPLAYEIALLKPHHILFTYLHLAPDPVQAKGLIASGATCIAYETILDDKGGLPLLTPMSQVAGRMAAQVGAACLLAPAGGRGLLMGGVPGVAPANVVILGGGVSGFNAAEIAVGMRADVTIMDISPSRLAQLDANFQGRARTLLSSRGALLELLPTADLVIGCVLVTGAAAPKLIRREDLQLMRKGSVLVDVSIDQGGCFETSKPTTHAEPTYEVDGVVHYCVANMPGAAPLTSTYALGAATTPYVLALAEKGVERALAEDPGFAAGLNVVGGRIVHPAVAGSLGLLFVAA
ncbi:alanine dehydrogenase [Phenylobacterium sp.]|jgi:alanine dehydrogenase|uniref:alanine dehydrogenase n=1 Tax=Phenylobacterium sp. TaxID=1871053 RepID=UPI002E2EC93A|nr:alanine dehydrogenase [Phenylobacterium sp.]HEX3366095.1 alanine dehydrogenase [Phenylobacterium sp.]